MGVLTDDMTRLNDEVNALRNARREFLKEQSHFVQRTRESAASTRTTLNAARAGGARAMWARITADHTARAVNVQEELASNEIERTAEAQRLQRVRNGFLSEVRGRVGEIRAGADHLRTALRDAHAEMVAAQRESRAKNKGMRNASEATRVEGARQASSARGGFLDGLRGQVDALRTGVTRLRGEFAADLGGAHLAWGGPVPSEEPKTKRPAPVKAEHKPVAKALDIAPIKAERRPAAKAADAAPDDLTVISGIGRGTQEHLNNAGIHTYAQLAGSNPGYLRTVLEGSGRRGNVEEWIAEAARLSR